MAVATPPVTQPPLTSPMWCPVAVVGEVVSVQWGRRDHRVECVGVSEQREAATPSAHHFGPGRKRR